MYSKQNKSRLICLLWWYDGLINFPSHWHQKTTPCDSKLLLRSLSNPFLWLSFFRVSVRTQIINFMVTTDDLNLVFISLGLKLHYYCTLFQGRQAVIQPCMQLKRLFCFQAPVVYPSPTKLLSFAKCPYSAQFINARHNNLNTYN